MRIIDDPRGVFVLLAMILMFALGLCTLTMIQLSNQQQILYNQTIVIQSQKDNLLLQNMIINNQHRMIERIDVIDERMRGK